MKKKNGFKYLSGTIVVLLVAITLVVSGILLQMYGLSTSNQLLVNLSPDVLGGGILIFALFLVVSLLGLIGIKVKMKYTSK